MVVTLTGESARIVTDQVQAGRFPSADAAVAAAVLRLQADPMPADESDELRSLVDVGLAEADRGEFVEFTAEDVIAERRAALRARHQGQA